MRLSRRQKAALHQAAAAAGLDDAGYRAALQEAAGVRSALDPRLTHEGFIRAMAHFEGLCCGRLPGFTAGYWFGASMRADPGDSLRVAVRREAAALGWTEGETEDFFESEHCSGGRCRRLASAPVYWLSRLLDGLKAMRARRNGCHSSVVLGSSSQRTNNQ